MAHTIKAEDVSWADRVLIVREPGDAGVQFVASVSKRIREQGYRGTVLETSMEPHKDLSALHIAVAGDVG